MHATSRRPRPLRSALPEPEPTPAAGERQETPARSPAWAEASGAAPPAALFGPERALPESPAADEVTPAGAPQVAAAARPDRDATAQPPVEPPVTPGPSRPFARIGTAARAPGLLIQRAAMDPGGGSVSAGEEAPGDLAGTPAGPARVLLVDDDAAPGPNQMGKTAFMAALREGVCTTVDEVLAGTAYSSQGCPYVEFWLGYYADRDAGHIERALYHYAPDTQNAASAVELIGLVGERVRRATQTWLETGRITGVPEGVPTSLFAPPSSPAGGESDQVAAKPVAGASAAHADPQALRRQLGGGRPLDGSIRTRMEPALGTDLSHVRVHTEPAAAGLSQSLRARAFTVGEHVAFGPGEYQPGTPIGDALLAHELAHTVQQSGAAAPKAIQPVGSAEYTGLEEDADQSAVGAVLTIWRGAAWTAGAIGHQALPRLRSGLRLQCCSSDKEKEPTETKPKDAGPKPAPADAGLTREQAEAAFVTHVKTVLGDNKVEPAEWAGIGKKARELKVDERDVRSRLSFDLDFERPWDDVVALLTMDDNAAIKTLISTYTTATTAAPIKLSTDPLPLLVAQILADGSIDQIEFDALRKFAFIFDTDQVKAALSAQNVTEPTLGGLLSMLELGFTDYNALAKQPGAFPIRLQKDPSGALSSTADLRQSVLTVITADDAWQHYDFKIVRSILGAMKRADAIAYLVAFGLDQVSADLLGGAFLAVDSVYKTQVADRGALDVKFQRTQAGLQMTPNSLATWRAPWHPTLIAPLAPVGGKGVTSTLEEEQDIGKYKFASGQEKQAGRITMTFRGQTIKVVMAEELYEDATLFDRVDAALSVVPPAHLKYLVELVLDPGNDPGGFAIANASRTGTVNMFFSGAGPHVAQASLNQTTAHEVGHLVSFQAEKVETKFWDKWKQAAKDDGIAVSRYGTTDELEDFAESYVLYLSGGGADAATRARFKNRWALLDPIFKWK